MRRYYSNSADEGMTMHDTAEEARACAEEELARHRERSGDGWHQDVGDVEWGYLVPLAEARECDRRETPGGEHDHVCDYRMHSVSDTMRDVLRACVVAMEQWGAEEDGIPEDGPIAEAYDAARSLLAEVK